MKKKSRSKSFNITDTILMLFFGYCEINVFSAKEDVLNFLLGRKIKFSAMSNTTECMSFRIYLYKKRELLSYLQKSASEFSVGESRGFPALIFNLSKKYGLVLGLIAFLAITVSAEMFIWEIKVSGNEKITDSEILREMSEFGVKTGARTASLDLDRICTDYARALPAHP